MARMIPASPVPEAPAAEARLYQQFRTDLPSTWTVIHSQRFLLPRRGGFAREGELDFLIVDPARGALGIEVKGGGVRRHRDGWFSTDRDGDEHPIKDPGRQAAAAVHAIRSYLKQAPGFGGRGFRCRFDWGVAFPDTVSPGDFGPDLPAEVILDRGSLLDLRGAVDRVFEYWGPSRGDGRALSPEAADALIETLCERHPPAATLALRFREEEREILRLTENQKVTLDLLAAHPRAAIEGGAGTGKTVLAAEKARRMATTGARVLLLCFNRPLAAYLRSAAEDYEVETFHEFCGKMARRAGLPFEEPTGPGHQDFWETTAPNLLVDALERLPEARYDAIVVDEGQDFMLDWWTCLDLSLKEGGEGTLYAFYDPNQNISNRHPPKALAIIPNRLPHNCRNTGNIARYIAVLIGEEARVRPGTPDGAPVEEMTCRDPAALARRVTERLERLVEEDDVRPQDIGIISTRRLENSPFAESRRAGRFRLVGLGDAQAAKSRGSRPRIVFDTLERFKGLERDVVVLLDLPGSKRAVTAARLYVGASRAKHLLVVARLKPSGGVPAAGVIDRTLPR